MSKLRVAIVGSGISGLSCAWYLSKKFNIDIYEKCDYFGGHSNTQTVLSEGKSIDVDTGFIVFNKINYINLCNFFDALNVKSYESDMSFSVSMYDGNLEYSGSSFLSLFAQKKNLFNINFLKMIYEIIKFYNESEKDRNIFRNLTIDEYLNKKRYSDYFKFNHLYPMASSIWSSPISKIPDFPFVEFVNFFSNHGLLRILNRPKWRTVEGGSKVYVKEVLKNKKINSFKGFKAQANKSKNGLWEIKFNNKIKRYDHLVLAVHSDEVQNVLKDYNNSDIKIFSNIKYSKNIVFLHSDRKLMPKTRKAWASWNYIESSSKVSVTYWMNKLQNLKTQRDFFVTLNPVIKPDINKVEREIIYTHPVYDFDTFETQKKIQSIQGKNNLWYCGAYLGYGFHEDGIKSGLTVAENLLNNI